MSERARIRRGTAPRAARQPAIARRGAAAAKTARKAVTTRAVATIPLPADRLARLWRRGMVAIGVGGVIALGWAVGVPGMIGTQLGDLAGMAGFSVKHCETVGSQHLDRLAVCGLAVDQTNSMVLVDLNKIRQQLLGNPWVADARVSRRLPDTLLVDIVERRPAAIWQNEGKLALIDPSGAVLAPVDPHAMPDLPVLVGPGANTQTQGLDALLGAAPRLKPLIAGATWVGGRRWDVRFQSGETLALPEGEGDERAAIAKFDRMDQAARLLGQGFVRFDMRVPGRFVVRVSREPGAEVKNPIGATPPSPATAPAPAGTDAI